MKLKNTYYIIRHGECLFNILNKNDSQGDPENILTEKGREQVTLCAKDFAKDGVIFQKIISSPFIRAKESAEICKQYVTVIDNEISIEESLKEMNHGSHQQGITMTTFDLNVDLHSKDGDGESYWDVRERLLTLLEKLESSYSDSTFLLVSHGTPVWMFYSAANNLNEEQTLEFKNKRNTDKGFFIKNAVPLVINSNA